MDGREAVMDLLDDYAAYIPQSFDEKPMSTNCSPMAMDFPNQCSAKTCPIKTYTAHNMMPKYEANKPSFASSSSSKIQLERNAGFRLCSALPIPAGASPCSPTFSNDGFHKGSLSGAHLSHHTPEHRR